jgi:hypothetical protein
MIDSGSQPKKSTPTMGAALAIMSGMTVGKRCACRSVAIGLILAASASLAGQRG